MPSLCEDVAGSPGFQEALPRSRTEGGPQVGEAGIDDQIGHGVEALEDGAFTVSGGCPHWARPRQKEEEPRASTTPTTFSTVWTQLRVNTPC